MRRARLILVVSAFVALVTLPRASSAQWQWTTDVGLSRLHQEQIGESNAMTLGTAVDAYSDRAWLRVSGLAARATLDRWTGQGVVVGSVLGPATTVARWELLAAGSAFAETGAGPTTSGEIMAGGRVGTSALGASFDAGGGVTHTAAGLDADGLFQAQGGVWRLMNDDGFGLNTVLTRTHRMRPSLTTPPVRDLISYVDLTGEWRRDHNGWSASLSAGARGAATNVSDGAWIGGEGAVWLTTHLALVASAGRALEDPIRGVPSTRYFTASVRVAAQPHERLDGAPKPQVTAGRARVEIALAGAGRVDLMADFTNWTPVPLVRSGHVWLLERSIPPGLHRIAIRVDGGAWTAPPGLPRETDDLGGVVGLITIP